MRRIIDEDYDWSISYGLITLAITIVIGDYFSTNQNKAVTN